MANNEVRDSERERENEKESCGSFFLSLLGGD